ncbi:SDR family NAD(P)-dependent oxidoreductase [Frankia tisae]|uniref:SDR family NAD(P)-dependent oxidoreductase n=1 Tax=Frankia tisae TaxID=2950104 RepID=UPI0021C0AA1A|nr:SDR family NAD(P)-dependent oxidoreductase [Frankia tisae]
MRMMVVTGGTDGIGRALADVHLRRGDAVLVVGQSAEKGERFLDVARELGAGDRAHFVRADLSLVSENIRLLEEISGVFPTVDVLVLGARYHRSVRTETAEGLESNFALFYVSRFLLSHGLAPSLEHAELPIVLNIAGPGGTGPIQWNDLQLRRHYVGTGALGHGGRLNDLLGAGFAEVHPDSPIRYILFNPGVVSTSFSGEYDRATAAAVAGLKVSGKTVAQSIGQILPCLDRPPAERLSAFVEGRRIDVDTPLFDRGEAARLHEITEKLLAT